jgi:hypothetical protein
LIVSENPERKNNYPAPAQYGKPMIRLYSGRFDFTLFKDTKF